MEKIERDYPIKYNLGWEGEIKISQIKSDLEELEKLGTTHVVIEGGSDGYDGYYIDSSAIARRIETDDEFLQRKKETERWNNMAEERDLREYERLKQKYNK